jgi:hypothetical protein
LIATSYGATAFAWLAEPKLALRFASVSEGWRARQDSNLRPLAPEANALSS